MLVEASALRGWRATKARQRLQSQPAVLQQLSRFRAAVETILKSRTQILTVAPSLIEAAATISFNSTSDVAAGHTFESNHSGQSSNRRGSLVANSCSRRKLVT